MVSLTWMMWTVRPVRGLSRISTGEDVFAASAVVPGSRWEEVRVWIVGIGIVVVVVNGEMGERMVREGVLVIVAVVVISGPEKWTWRGV